jgi:hypothetical protein
MRNLQAYQSSARALGPGGEARYFGIGGIGMLPGKT